MKKLKACNVEPSLDYTPKGSVTVNLRLPGNFARDFKMYAMKYSTLITLACNHIASNSEAPDPKQTIGNFKSCCNSWLEFHSKDISKHNVGAEMNSRFEECLNSYLKSLSDCKLAPATIRDRKSIILKLNKIYMQETSILKGERVSDLGSEIRNLLLKAEWSQDRLSKETGLPKAFIQRTVNGARPQESGEEKIRRIEFAFKKNGVIEKHGHLVELLKRQAQTSQSSKVKTPLNPIEVQEAKASYSGKTERQLKSWSIEKLREQLPVIHTFLFRYKEYKFGHGMWRTCQVTKITPLTWVFNHDGQSSHCPTFDIYLQSLCSFISYLLDYKKIPLCELNSLDVLLEPTHWVAFVNFLKARRDGMLGNNKGKVRALCSGLLEEISRQVDENLIERPLKLDKLSKVKETLDTLVKKDAGGRIRDPWQKLEPLFNLENPLSSITDIAKDLESIAKLPHVYLKDAVAIRDAFLIRLLRALPLRERSIVGLTYKSDGTGHFKYSQSEKAWKVELPAYMVKNNKPITRTLPCIMNPLIEKYLLEARPTILLRHEDASNIHWLFISKSRETKKKYLDEDGQQIALLTGQLNVSQRISALTQQYLGLAIRTHSFRHLVATSFLKAHPGYFRACADLLGDRIETVTKHYAYNDPKWSETVLNSDVQNSY